jgi:hypothetical protein
VHGSHALSAVVGGYHVAFLIGAVFVAAAIVVAFTVLKDPAHAADPHPALRRVAGPCMRSLERHLRDFAGPTD